MLGVLMGALLLALPAAAQQRDPGVYVGKVMAVEDRSVRIDFRAMVAGEKNPSVVLFYGTKDAGTDAQAWEKDTGPIDHDKDLALNDYSVPLDGLAPQATYSYRIRLTVAGGEERWSDLGQFTTAPPRAPWYETAAILMGVLVVLVGPFAVGGWLANRWRIPDFGWKIGLILFALVGSIVITWLMWPPSLGPDLSGGTILVYELEDDDAAGAAGVAVPPKEEAAAEKDDAPKGQDPGQAERKYNMDDLVQAILLRVNPSGTREVSIREYGPRQIEVTIPRANENEVRRIKERIVSAGSLVFRILASVRDHRDAVELARATEGRTVYNREHTKEIGWWVPVLQGHEGEFEENADVIQRSVVDDEGQRRLEVFVVDDDHDVTGDDLATSQAAPDNLTWCVNFTFNNRGSRAFGYLTAENEPDKEGITPFYRKLGIVLDGNLYSAPRIITTIMGSGQITGSFTEEAAHDLADVLNAGRLPATLKKVPIFEWTTGPTLGRDMIRSSSFSLALAVALVFVFMVIYYRLAGLVAALALVLNVALTLAVMILVKADFSLPGLAGFVLSIGMSVDANVIIFERIREELQRGATLRMAIRNGFDRAMSAVVDGNLTVLLSSVILWWIGTTQIKGFAVVLSLGVIFSMFTGVFCSHVILDIAERRRWITKLNMMQMVRKTNFDFVGLFKYGVVFSITLIVVGMAAVVDRGKGLLDIDFTGGESVVIVFKERTPIAQVREDLKDLRDLIVSDVRLEGEGEELRFLINTSEEVDLTLPENQGLSAIDVIERRIYAVFGNGLATNGMTVGTVRPIPAAEEKSPASSSPTEKTEKDAAPDKPAPANQSRVDLPPSTWLASVDPAAVLLAQAEPAAGKTPETSGAKAETTKSESESKPESASKETPSTESKPDAKAESTPVPATPPRDPFAGGVQVELAFEQPLDEESLLSEIQTRLEAAKLSVPIDLKHVKPSEAAPDAQDRWILKVGLAEEQLRKLVLDPLGEELRSTAYFPASSSIGSKVAGNMQTSALIALVASMIATIIYLWVRFQRVMFGLAAVIALVHDVLIALGLLAISVYVAPFLGFLMIEEFKIGLVVLAAFLTIIGYSVNDTIIVFDRIREIRGKSPHVTSAMINEAINATLSRTLITSGITGIVTLVLYIGGGQAIHAFAFTMLLGVVFGTYSSIAIASPLLLWIVKPPVKK